MFTGPAALILTLFSGRESVKTLGFIPSKSVRRNWNITLRHRKSSRQFKNPEIICYSVVHPTCHSASGLDFTSCSSERWKPTFICRKVDHLSMVAMPFPLIFQASKMQIRKWGWLGFGEKPSYASTRHKYYLVCDPRERKFIAECNSVKYSPCEVVLHNRPC